MAAQVQGDAETKEAPSGVPFFAGSFPGKLDAKGRVILPPLYRQRLRGDVFIFPSLVGPELQIGDVALHDLVLKAVKGLDVVDGLDRRLTDLQNAVVQRLQPVSVDDAGRVMVPAAAKAHARLEGALSFAGRGGHFVLARADHLEAKEADALAFGSEAADTLAALMRPSLRGGDG